MTLELSNTKELAEVEISPRDVVARAKEQADVLIDIVKARGLYREISGKRYLLAEAWETIGAFNSVVATTEWVKALKDNQSTIGWEAKVNLVHREQGNLMGSAIMSCGMDEFPCRGKTGEAANKAAKSAAQTWAASKAYRLNYSWVVVLAGFEPTPADEMIGTENRPASPRRATKQTQAAPEVQPSPSRPSISLDDYLEDDGRLTRDGLLQLLTTEFGSSTAEAGKQAESAVSWVKEGPGRTLKQAAELMMEKK